MAKIEKWLPWLFFVTVAGVFLWKKKSGSKLLNRFNAGANAQALNPNVADKTTQITETQQVVQDGGMSLDDPNSTATKTQQIKDYK